eukprot:CCRYP_018964-RF/>CCRYP_018964-RF protein AED:0.46 eAED:1.00 QI:0/0/0/1/0/0/2/0/153
MNHTANGPPNNPGRGLEVEGTTGVVGVHALRAELSVLGLVTDEGTGDDHFFASHEDNFLASKEFLGDDGAQTTMEMVAAINNNRFFKHHDHFSSKDWIQLNAVSGIPERDHHMSTCQGGHQHVYRRRSVATQHHPKVSVDGAALIVEPGDSRG